MQAGTPQPVQFEHGLVCGDGEHGGLVVGGGTALLPLDLRRGDDAASPRHLGEAGQLHALGHALTAHEPAAPRRALEQAVALEHGERIAEGDPAHAHLGGEVALARQLLVRREHAVRDEGGDRVARLRHGGTEPCSPLRISHRLSTPAGSPAAASSMYRPTPGMVR